MEVSRRSLTVAVTLSLLILCSGCATLPYLERATLPYLERLFPGLVDQHYPAAGILPGTHLVTIPPDPSVAPRPRSLPQGYRSVLTSYRGEKIRFLRRQFRQIPDVIRDSSLH